jgi:hypothetical protein
MSFCTVCGRERTTATRFCGGCGAESGDSVRREKTSASPPPGGDDAPPPAGWDRGGPDLVRPRLEPVRPTDPFSAFFATVDSFQDELPSASIGRSAGRARAPRRRSRSVIVAAVAAVVLAAPGGAYALAAGQGQARAGDQPTGRASASATPSATAGQGTTAVLGPPGGRATGTTTVVREVGVVAVAPGAASNPAARRVAALLDRYFTAINRRDYAAYARLLDRRRLRSDPAASFEGGYASSTDSDETLTRISAVGSGNVAVSVTFTSHQKQAISRDHSSCTLWAITLYLVAHGSGYLIGMPPPGYWASYQAC